MDDLFEKRVFDPVTLTTDRLRLRPFSAEDVAETQRACSDELTHQWLWDLPDPYTLEDARQHCLEFCESTRLAGDGVRCAVALTQTRALVGSVGIVRVDWDNRCAEIGYWAVPEHRRRGYMTEATRALADWAISQGIQRVELFIAPGNTGSMKLAQNAGFTLEGTLRNRGTTRTGREDLSIWSRIPGDA